MIRAYYEAVLALSLVLMLAYVCLWHKHFDVHITLVFALVPVANLGWFLLNRADTLAEAILAVKLTYVGGCYLLPIIMFSVFSLCHIQLPRLLRMGVLAGATVLMLGALTIGQSPLIYRSVTLEHVDGAAVLTKEYGPLHTVFYGMILLCFLVSIGAVVYSYVRKKQVSRKLIYLLFLPVMLCMVSFFAGRRLFPRIELIPAAYDVAMIVYLIIGHRICMYDITDTATDSLVQTGDTGLISFDFRFNYLGSNGTAKEIFPELNELVVDKPVADSPVMAETALRWLRDFAEDNSKTQVYYERDDRIYLVQVGYLFDGTQRRGYQFFITDDTADRKYIRLLDGFNTQLRDEVARQTAHIVEMHDNLILSMATMVESRDNSTGGHIRRASEGVRLLAAEVRADSPFYVTEEFCRDLEVIDLFQRMTECIGIHVPVILVLNIRNVVLNDGADTLCQSFYSLFFVDGIALVDLACNVAEKLRRLLLAVNPLCQCPSRIIGIFLVHVFLLCIVHRVPGLFIPSPFLRSP